MTDLDGRCAKADIASFVPVTRDDVTARQQHLHRGVYPVHYPEPRGIPTAQWQIDVDNRIR
jgi:pyruvate kinase